MYISDKLVFVELPKTGCSHIGRLLAELVEGRQEGKHNYPDSALRSSGSVFLGSIRDPWDWYVSLWAFSCSGEGTLYHSTMKTRTLLRGRGWSTDKWRAGWSVLRRPARPYGAWSECYRDISKSSNFQDWLRMMHDRSCAPDLGGSYWAYPMADFAGFLTHQYLCLFCGDDFWDAESVDDLKEFDRRDCYVDHFVRNEYLEQDFLRALVATGVDISPTAADRVCSAAKTNVSVRDRGLARYYDQETVELVADRERFVIEKFGYTPPVL